MVTGQMRTLVLVLLWSLPLFEAANESREAVLCLLCLLKTFHHDMRSNWYTSMPLIRILYTVQRGGGKG